MSNFNKLTWLLGMSLILMAQNVYAAWDCSNPQVDCGTLIIQRQSPSHVMGLSNRDVQAIQQNTAILKVPEDVRPEELMEQLQKLPEVRLVEPALRIQLAQTARTEIIPNDPHYDDQYYLSGLIGDNMQIHDAWNLLTFSDVVIAVIDSGIDYTHEDLSANIWHNIGEIPNNNKDDDKNGFVDDVIGYNFYDNTNDPLDEHMHGTHVSGIIGAVGNNRIGVTGLLWQTQLMGLRFTDGNGAGNTATAIQAIHYAVNNGARVINLSWTIQADGLAEGSQALANVIHDYSDAGVIFIAAAGNGDALGTGIDIDETPIYPAAIQDPVLISVAALAYDGKLASYSNYGINSVHIAAPGTGIYNTMPGDSYGTLTGTSSAAGFVSAAAAMILQEAPELTGAQVKNLLINEANVSDFLSPFVSSGGSLGMMNALSSTDSPASLASPASSKIMSPNADSNLASGQNTTTQAASSACQLVLSESATHPLPLFFLILFASAFFITIRIKP